MRITGIALSLFLALGLISCTREDENRDGASARQAGRDAYRASQEAKRDLKEAEREVQKAGKAFRDGWNEARSKDKSSHDK